MKTNLLPIEYEDFDYDDEGRIYLEVTFLNDFGNYKKGDKLDHLWFNYDGFIYEVVEGEVTNKQNVKFVIDD